MGSRPDLEAWQFPPRHLAGAARWLYAVAAVLGLYLNVFVAIVQAFKKVPALEAIAPTASEPPFAFTQLAALALFVVLGIVAAIRFHPGAAAPAPRARRA